MENLPQYIWLSLMAIGLLWAAHTHGQKRDDDKNFWVTLVAYVLSAGLLYWGGFFDKLLN